MGCYSDCEFHNLEHRDICAEPECECDSLGHIVQFPLRYRSTATRNHCNSRLFQNRFAHGGCDSGTCWRRYANSDANTNGNGDTDCDHYTNTNCNSNGDCQWNTHCDSAAYSDAKVYPVTEASPDSGASPVGANAKQLTISYRIFAN